MDSPRAIGSATTAMAVFFLKTFAIVVSPVPFLHVDGRVSCGPAGWLRVPPCHTSPNKRAETELR